jgi:hypothetical protein
LGVDLCHPFSEEKKHILAVAEREKTKRSVKKKRNKIKDWRIIYDETIHNL